MVEFVSASKKTKRNKKGSCLVQVVSFFVAVFFALFLSLVPIKEGDHNPSLRDKGMISLWTQPEESDITDVHLL